MYPLPKSFEKSTVLSTIESFQPDTVVAVGGDGTANFLADCLKGTSINLGFLPAGSANGMAKELEIHDVPTALKAIDEGHTRLISLVDINGRTSLHLSDIGLNAFMLREFERRGIRGFIGYLLATIKVLSSRKPMHVDITFNNEVQHIRADLILIANATMYGTGVLVNPVGKLDDNVFEIIAISDLTIADLVDTSIRTLRLNPNKAKIFQAAEMTLHCKRPAHFQVDGEYMGRVTDIKAKLLPACLNVVVPVGPNA